MSVIIPIGSQPTAAVVPRPSAGLQIPFRFGVGTAGGLQQREQQVLRAVAAAVAISHTAETLTLAREAQQEGEDPGARLKSIVVADLRVVLDEVVRVQGNRAGAPGPDEEQRVVAAEVGADAVLVAAAHAKVAGNNKVAKAARDWVASIDAALLERAARAGARREFLTPPKPTPTELEEIRKEIAEIKKRLPPAGGGTGGG